MWRCVKACFTSRIDEYTVWIATPNGISQIQQVEMTLEEKAAQFEKVIDARHNRRGLVNVSHLTVPGDISSSKIRSLVKREKSVRFFLPDGVVNYINDQGLYR